MTILPPSMFGVPVLRSEDPRLLRGQGRYLENIPIEGALRAMFVRSIMPHARLVGVDLGAARAVPGVVAAYTADPAEHGMIHLVQENEIALRDGEVADERFA